MNKALEPEKKLFSNKEVAEIVTHLLHMNCAIKEHNDHLMRTWNFIDPQTTAAANLKISELQSTRTEPHSAEEFAQDEVAGTVSLGVACRSMGYLMHERDAWNNDRELVQTPKLNCNTQLSVNSSKTIFTGIDPSQYDFNHIICNRGYYDKDQFIHARSANVSTQDEELNNYSVIDISQLYFTDHHEYKFTVPPDPIQCRSEVIFKAASPSKSPNQIISDEQTEWLNDHIFKPVYLASIQAAELKELDESPSLNQI